MGPRHNASPKSAIEGYIFHYYPPSQQNINRNLPLNVTVTYDDFTFASGPSSALTTLI